MTLSTMLNRLVELLPQKKPRTICGTMLMMSLPSEVVEAHLDDLLKDLPESERKLKPVENPDYLEIPDFLIESTMNRNDDLNENPDPQPERRRGICGNLLMSMPPEQARAVLERLAEKTPDDAPSMTLVPRDQPPA